MIKRAFWTAAWRLTVLGLVALAIALLPSTQSIGTLPPATSPHPLPATTQTLAPAPLAQVDWRYRRDLLGKDQQPDGEIPHPLLTSTGATYQPREEIAAADPSNYGPRFLTDIYGRPVSNSLLVVIHETVGSASSAVNLMQTYHPRDEDQVSYHSIIRRDGTIVHLVHPQMRAFGAGNSVFTGPNGPEAVQTNPEFPPSVNNFAYHTSLETPSDGRGNQSSHSGYTEEQYLSLAWLVAHLPVPDERITTHRAVDRSGTRRDPRSFSAERFYNRLHAYVRSTG
ncbi:MAG: peptidoglycan recognition family protein [Synechococcales bacterium]|nr:peptidoglycan recognition family protein [Synechococcales bacterium]